MKRLVPTPGSNAAAVLLVFVLLVGGTGVAAAAVTGDFSSSYDGYNDGTDTEVRGHEIQASGTLEFTGENAVEPHIVIRPSQHTVLDDESVQLLQPGDTSVDFDRHNTDGGVRYTADEIPSGTELDIEFVVYPVSGLSQSEIKSGEVRVVYERPSGGTERTTVDVNTELSNTPPQVISSQQSGQQMGLVVRGLAVVGGLAVLLVVVMGLYSLVSGGNGGPKRPN